MTKIPKCPDCKKELKYEIVVLYPFTNRSTSPFGAWVCPNSEFYQLDCNFVGRNLTEEIKKKKKENQKLKGEQHENSNV